VIAEALGEGSAPGVHGQTSVSVKLDLPSRSVISTVDVEQMGEEKYLSGASKEIVYRTEMVMAAKAMGEHSNAQSRLEFQPAALNAIRKRP